MTFIYLLHCFVQVSVHCTVLYGVELFRSTMHMGLGALGELQMRNFVEQRSKRLITY